MRQNQHSYYAHYCQRPCAALHLPSRGGAGAVSLLRTITTVLPKTVVALLFWLLAMPTMAQQPRCHFEAADSITIERLLASGETDVLYYARQFLGLPYVAHTLELYPDDERLVLNTRELDCTTYVDVVVALTLCARRGATSFWQFVQQLQSQRYWDGVCNDYTSRIHYFSDWIRDNSRLGFVAEVQRPSPPFTAVQTVSVGYMTIHPDAYISLVRHPEYLPAIAKQEEDLTGKTFRYIPTAKVKNTKLLRQTVHDGDIICIVTSATGLDIAHLGIAVWHDDGLHMIHACFTHKVVEEDAVCLHKYLKNRKNAEGIRIVRLNTK